MADLDRQCARTFLASFWGMFIFAFIFPPLAVVSAWVCIASLVTGLLGTVFDRGVERGWRDAEQSQRMSEAAKSKAN